MQVLVVAAAVVIGTDQATKWWAWRNFDPTLINSGGYIMLGPVIRSWFAGTVSGPVADVIGSVLLFAGVRRLLRRRRPTSALIGGGLVMSGVASNILDRLGLHRWTAPGSARGVMDFIPGGGPGRSNVADLWIVVGVLLLGYALVRYRRAASPGDEGTPGEGKPGDEGKPDDEGKPGEETPEDKPAPPAGGVRRLWSGIAALIAVLALVALAVLSALGPGGVYAPTDLPGP